VTIWIAIALAVLVTVIAALAGRGTIPNNGLVGIRTPSIQRTNETWTEAHRAATPLLIGLAIAVTIAGIIGLVTTSGSTDDTPNFIGLGLLGLDVVVIVAAAIRANTVARRNLH